MKTLTTYILLLMSTYTYATADAIRLTLAGNNYSDQTTIRFINGATDTVDESYDAVKLFSPNKQVPALFTMVNAITKLSTNTYPLLSNGGIRTNVYIRNYVAKTYTISCQEFGAISPSVKIYMEDTKTGNLYNLRVDSNYTFQLSIDSVSHNPRFVVHFIVPATLITNAASCSASNNGNISVSKPGMDTWNYQLSDSSGNIIKADSNINSTTSINNLFAGNYNLNVYTTFGYYENLAVTVAAMAVSPEALFLPSADSVYVTSPTVLFNNQSVEATKFIWNFGDQDVDSLSADPSHTYKDTGMYVVHLIAKNGMCSSVSQKAVHVLPLQGLALGITSNNNSKKIKVYNSSEGLMVTIGQSLSNESYNVAVYNTVGQLLYNNRIQNPAENYLLPHFNSADNILIVQVTNGKEMFSQKIFAGQ